MKTKFLAALTAMLLVSICLPCFAADPASATYELRQLVAKVQAKRGTETPTEASLAPELKEFDELLAKHAGEKTDEVVQILWMKAMLYSQVLTNEAKSKELLEQLKRDFPDSELAAMLKQQEEAEKIQATLVVGTKFPDFDEKDTEGKPLSIARYKGKVVLVDFWATWCPPCVIKLPDVIKAYEKHRAEGFEIIGINLDPDKDRLESFIKQKKMTWPQFFDGQGWQNKLAKKYGVNRLPATFLLDANGIILAKDLSGEALEAAVAKALTKK